MYSPWFQVEAALLVFNIRYFVKTIFEEELISKKTDWHKWRNKIFPKKKKN